MGTGTVPVALDEVLADRAPDALVDVIDDLTCRGSLETRMRDRHDEPATRPENPGHRMQRPIQVRDVHQRHVADRPVERVGRDSVQCLRITMPIRDSQRLCLLVLPSSLQQLLRQIDTSDDSTPAGEVARFTALTACHHTDLLACDISGQLGKVESSRAEPAPTHSSYSVATSS